MASLFQIGQFNPIFKGEGDPCGETAPTLFIESQAHRQSNRLGAWQEPTIFAASMARTFHQYRIQTNMMKTFVRTDPL